MGSNGISSSEFENIPGILVIYSKQNMTDCILGPTCPFTSTRSLIPNVNELSFTERITVKPKLQLNEAGDFAVLGAQNG